MQADIALAVELDRRLAFLELPEREHQVAVRDEGGRIVGPLADQLPAQALHEEVAGLGQVANGQAEVIDAAGERAI